MRFFISHQSDDKLAAFDLERKLDEIPGVTAWLDMFELNAGDSFDEIPEAIREADAIIVLWSTSADVSEWVRAEVDWGEEFGVRVIPCVLDEHLPTQHPVLRDRLYLDFRHPALGIGHLCLSYVIPTVLADHGHDDVERKVQRYGGVVAQCIRELIVRQRGLDTIEQWVDRARETRDEAFEAIAGLGSSRWRRAAPEIEDIVGGVYAILEEMHETLEQVLQDLSVRHQRGELDDGPVDVATLFRDFDRVSAHDEFDARLSEFDLPIPRPLAAGLLTYYVESSFDVVEALIGVAERLDDEAGAPADDADEVERADEALDRINQALCDYLVAEDDVIPDDSPGVGYLDDAWLIHNVAHRLVESGLATPTEIPVDLRLTASADRYARALMGRDATEELETFLLELVAIAARHADEYDPYMEADDDGTLRLYLP